MTNNVALPMQHPPLLMFVRIIKNRSHRHVRGIIQGYNTANIIGVVLVCISSIAVFGNHRCVCGKCDK